MIAIGKRIMGWVLLLLAAAAGIVAGVAVFLGLAFLFDPPLLLALAAVLVGGLVAWGLARVPGRWAAPRFSQPLAIGFGMGTAVLLVVSGGLFLFRPTGFDRPIETTSVHARFVDLDTGSRLAYYVISSRIPERRGQVIFVHGGPGSNAVASATFFAALSPLADQGFDVCLYDQIGSGLSARLDDPLDYTATRHVADLDALRNHLQWEKPVLIGKSWGAQLIARYAARHPDAASGAVLVSPGPLRPADWTERETGGPGDRLDADQKQAFDKIVDARLITAVLLMKINPRAAVRFLPEAEAEQYGSAILDALAPAAVCDPAVLSQGTRPTMNMWAARLTMASIKNEPENRLDTLAEVDFPILILRGECDYGRPEISEEYLETFPDARLVTVPDAGHFLLLEAPGEFLRETRAVLESR